MIETAQAVPITGNFETSAQNLAMRLAWRGCLRPCYFQEIPIKYLYYKRLFNSSANSSNPGLPNKANIFFLYASTPGWSNGFTPFK